MTQLQFYFFATYLLIQILIPSLRFLKFLWRPKQSTLFGDYFWFFSWTMKLTRTQGVVGVAIFDKAKKQTIVKYPVEGTLPNYQFELLYNHPTTAIQYAKYIGKKMKLKEENFGIRMEIVSYINDIGPINMVDKSVDFTEEKEKRLAAYDWYLQD